MIKIKEMRRGDGDISDDSNLDENIEFALGFNKTVDRNERPRVPGLTESAQISNPELAKRIIDQRECRMTNFATVMV